MSVLIDYAALSQIELDLLEHYRRVLNEMRATDARTSNFDDLAARVRSLRREIDSRGIDSNALLHDRHWAREPVPGSAI